MIKARLHWTRLIKDGGKQGIEFYAFENDPRGLRNVAHDSTYVDTVSVLQTLLHSMCHSP